MQRLLMGEVGSGKTVVALYAMLRAAEAGMQAALMAPTETLAEQHFATIERLIAGRPVRRRRGDAARAADRAADGLHARARAARACWSGCAAGELRLLVGTHALIEQTVEFDAAGAGGGRRAAPLRRAPAHRARRARRAGELAPHLLHMTATPIPRTLSLTLYGDLHTTRCASCRRAGGR